MNTTSFELEYTCDHDILEMTNNAGLYVIYVKGGCTSDVIKVTTLFFLCILLLNDVRML